MNSQQTRSGRFRVVLWLALLAFFVNVSGVAADDCEKEKPDGETRSCTYLEEVRECLDDAQDSWNECMWDALEIDNFFEQWLARTGCEAAFFVNGIACGISVTSDWLF